MNFTESKKLLPEQLLFKIINNWPAPVAPLLLWNIRPLEPAHLAVPLSELPELSEEMVASPLDHGTAPSPPRLSLHARLHLR